MQYAMFQLVILKIRGKSADELAEILVKRLESEEETFAGNERFHLFLATGLRESGPPEREATEQMELELVPLAAAAELAFSGRIHDAPSALALILAHHKLGRAA